MIGGMDDDQSRQEYEQPATAPVSSVPPAVAVASESPPAPEVPAEPAAAPTPVATTPEQPEPATEAAPTATLQSIHQESATADAVIRGIWVMVWVLAAVLFVRFLLHLLGADPNNRVIDMLYTYTHPLVAPFFAMFHYNQELIERRFEFENLLAILLYGVIAWGLVVIIKLLTRRKRNKVVTPPPAAGAPHD